MAHHGDLMEHLQQQKEELAKLMEMFDPYEKGFRVLDTDYDNYLLVYHCWTNDPPEEEDKTAEEEADHLVHARKLLASYVKSKHLESGRYTEFQHKLRDSMNNEKITD